MRQIQFNSYGKPEVLEMVEVNIPEPKTSELLIKVAAAGVNYADVLRRKNVYFMPTPLPFVLGTEAVGEIVAVGEEVNTQAFQVGQRVLAILPTGGGYSEYVSADAQFCLPLPPQIDAADATAIFVQGSTAHLMLHQVAKKLNGKSILIHAASGGVGSLLVQLAKLGGAKKVIGASSSDEKLAVARSFGADETVNYSNGDWTRKVIEANGGKKVDLILEMVGGKIYTQSFECLEKGGTMIVYGAVSGEKGMMHSEHFVNESQSLLSFNLAYFVENKVDLWQEAISAIINLIAEGKLKISVKETFSLPNAVQAHTRLENRLTMGKVVLKP